MQFGILGGGALGLLWAARLLDFEPVVVTRTQEQWKQLQKEGLQFTDQNGNKNIVQLPSFWGNLLDEKKTFDVLFVMVKQKDIMGVIPWIQKHTHSESQILFWQNGLGHEEWIKTLIHRPWTYLVVTTEGALKEADNAVRHTGRGKSWIGLYPEHKRFHPMMQKLLDQWERPFAIHMEKHIMVRIWEKLAINCVINPLTALSDVTNGELLSQKDEVLWKGILNEVVQVAEKEGVSLHTDQLMERVIHVCTQTAKNISSMLRDIQHGRKTEVDAINGAIVRLGTKHHVPTPLNSRLVRLIHEKEGRML